MTPKITELLQLSDSRDWLANPAAKQALLLEALDTGLLPGKELAWPVEQYLIACHREDLLRFIAADGAGPLPGMVGDPVFRSMLRYDVLANHLLESVLMLLRRQLMLQFSAGQPVDLSLVCDLALYFHFTGFMAGTLQQEVTALGQLVLRHGQQPGLLEYAVLSLYVVPVLTDQVRNEAAQYRSFAQLLAEHQEAAELRRLASTARAETDVIGQQYTSFPYPLWRPPCAFMEILQAHLLAAAGGEASARCLIAGCGTGRQPLITLSRNAAMQVEIDAIDISAASIHYARKRLAAFERWIHLQQADIADWCKAHPQHYDNIECIGVLHHTPDDRRYLEALLTSARPGCKITLGLYSKKGREEVLEAREFSRQFNVGDELRKLRGKILQSNLSRKDVLLSHRDFYTRSEFKDLVANNREKNYSTADIGALLAGLPVRIVWFQGVENCLNLGTAEILKAANLREEREPKFYAGMFLFTLEVAQ